MGKFPLIPPEPPTTRNQEREELLTMIDRRELLKLSLLGAVVGELGFQAIPPAAAESEADQGGSKASSRITTGQRDTST